MNTVTESTSLKMNGANFGTAYIITNGFSYRAEHHHPTRGDYTGPWQSHAAATADYIEIVETHTN